MPLLKWFHPKFTQFWYYKSVKLQQKGNYTIVKLEKLYAYSRVEKITFLDTNGINSKKYRYTIVNTYLF